jgi:zona occludens toxin (predicted ATPase)
MPPYENSMIDNKGHCWKKQKAPLLMEASSTQKATCAPKMVHFNVIKKENLQPALQKCKNVLPVTTETEYE